MCKPFLRRNTCCISRENGAAQGKKARCLGVLTAFRYALIGSSPYKREFLGKGYTLQEKIFCFAVFIVKMPAHVSRHFM